MEFAKMSLMCYFIVHREHFCKTMSRALEILRSKCQGNGFDYGFAISCLKEWSNPRSALARLVREGDLIQLKRGFYLFSPSYQRGELNLELVANQLLGPSYVSLEWALQRYGMIPERVHEITSVTTKRRRLYTTPVGRFSYTHLHPLAFPAGVEQVELPGNERGLIASREKAVIDLLVLRRGRVTSSKELQELLFEDFRFEEEDLRSLDLKEMDEIYRAYPHSAVHYLYQFIQRLQS